MQMNAASKLFVNGRKGAALFEYAQLGIVGIESAQFNAAFLLSTGQMVSETCPELNTELYKSSISDPRLNNRIQYFPANVASPGGQFSTADGITPPTTPLSVDNLTAEDQVLRSNKVVFMNPAAITVNATNNQSGRRSRWDACEARAMLLFGLSAAQSNGEALLSLGDFHYYRKGGLPWNRAEV